MESGWPPLQEPESKRIWGAVVAGVAADLGAHAADLAVRVADLMRAELPEFISDAEAYDQQVASAEASLRAISAQLERGGDPRAVILPAATVAVATTGVHRLVALTPMLRSYRLGHQVVWQWLLARISERTPEPIVLARAADLLSAWLFAFVDTSSSLAEQLYETERDEWMRSAMAARVEAVEAILSGRECDARRASTRLGYELGRHHVGVVAWVESAPEGSDPQPALNRLLQQLGQVVGADAVLVCPRGAKSSVAWISRARAFGDGDLGKIAIAVEAITHEFAPLLAVGTPGRGLTGFRASQTQAGHARRVATLIGAATGSVTRYDEVAVVAMATVDPEQARAHVVGVLGGLAADDEATYRVAETLAVYLEENHSRNRAAARLHIHANTVAYRVRQAESILGHAIGGGDLDLRVALAMLPALRGLPSS
ncbi:helix-turn-helix domain-containing protein [Nocardia sp. NPDC004604]|uniref:PucR family transcriptional regulator n=1 Tax=Nocardia sp. NPDC004604 TaxID=3157013 RepID=UPI0033B0E9FA